MTYYVKERQGKSMLSPRRIRARIKKRTAYLTVKTMQETACGYYETLGLDKQPESIWLHQDGATLHLRRCHGQAQVQWNPLNGEIRLIGPGRARKTVYSCGGASLVDRRGKFFLRAAPPCMGASPSGHP